MKTVLAKILAMSSVALLMLASCNKNDPKVVTTGGTPGSLTASTNTVVLNKANASDTTSVIQFTLTPAHYTYKAAVTTAIQIDSVGDNWAKPTTVAVALSASSANLSTAVLNTALLQILPGGVTAKVNVRVQYALNSTVASYSNVLSLTVTPYSLASYIYIVGDFQGWNAASPDSLVSPTSNGVYTGSFAFTTGNNQFLILPAKNFNNKYATNQANTVIPSTTAAYNAPNNFYAPNGNGTYTITFDINALTISSK